MLNDPNNDAAGSEKMILQLYVAGMSENSMSAIENIRRLGELHLKDCFELEIVDIYKQPSLAAEQQIVFTPSLVKISPLPRKTFIGNLSDTRKLMQGLDIVSKTSNHGDRFD